MPRRPNHSEDEFPDDWDGREALNDPDGPQLRDLTDPNDETPTVPCPNCGAQVPDLADRCPYCGEWIVQSSGAVGSRSLVLAAIAVLLILALLFWLM